MKKNYYLMNKDTRIMEFYIENSILGEQIIELQSFSKLRPHGFVDIATFIENRNYAKHKSHFKKWLKEWGINTADGFCDITHCLGINDTLWVKSADSPLQWAEVSLYTNEFSDVAQQTAFETGLYGLQLSSTDLMSPEFTSEGTCPKCWKRENGKVYLYKAGLTGASNVGLEPYSEYMASHIVNMIVSNSVSYDLVKFKGKVCTRCELFTDEARGYVPFYKFVDANRRYNLNDVLNICKDMGFEDECREMIFTDSIVFNQDRHLGNFGFLVDNDTFETLDFVSLFDYNSSMLCNALDSDLDDFDKYEEEYMIGHKLGGKFAEIGHAIADKKLLDKVPSEIVIPMHDKYNMPKDRLDKLSKILEENLKEIIKR